MSKKLKLPILFIAVCFSAVLLGSAVTRHYAKYESVVKVAQFEQTQIPGGPYNDVIGPHQQPAPKPEIDQPLP